MYSQYFRRCTLVVLVSMLAIPALPDDNQKPLKSIAVLEFDAKGVSKLEASTLTDRFRSELVQTHVFLQIERSRIEQIFKEQKLQMSGTVSDDKLVEIGELLGAELLVIGSIGKLGSTYTIDLRLVEVESGEIIASYFKDHRGEVDGLLDLFRVIAGEIAGKEYRSPVVSSPPEMVLKSNTIQTTVVSSLAAAQMKAKNDADSDFSKFVWGAGGAASGTAGGCLLGVPGGLLATGAVVGAGYMTDASPPPDRLKELSGADLQIQQIYTQTYEDELKAKRAKWGGGSSTFGCCIGSLLAVVILASTTTY